MVQVHLWSGLRDHAEGRETVEVQAATVGQMLAALRRDWPGLAPILDEGVSVAVDGEMCGDDLTVPLTESSEVYLLQRVRGG